MSLCDTCAQPGHCCRKFDLSSSRGEVLVPEYEEPTNILSWVSSEDLPFVPLERKVAGAEASTWWWTCPKLTSEGRCSIYDERPGICRQFEAGSDPLCVHYVAPETPAVEEVVT